MLLSFRTLTMFFSHDSFVFPYMLLGPSFDSSVSFLFDVLYTAAVLENIKCLILFFFIQLKIFFVTIVLFFIYSFLSSIESTVDFAAKCIIKEGLIKLIILFVFLIFTKSC